MKIFLFTNCQAIAKSEPSQTCLLLLARGKTAVVCWFRHKRSMFMETELRLRSILPAFVSFGRPPREFASNHLHGAFNLPEPIENLVLRHVKVIPDSETQIAEQPVNAS